MNYWCIIWVFLCGWDLLKKKRKEGLKAIKIRGPNQYFANLILALWGRAHLHVSLSFFFSLPPSRENPSSSSSPLRFCKPSHHRITISSSRRPHLVVTFTSRLLLLLLLAWNAAAAAADGAAGQTGGAADLAGVRHFRWLQAVESLVQAWFFCNSFNSLIYLFDFWIFF